MISFTFIVKKKIIKFSNSITENVCDSFICPSTSCCLLLCLCSTTPQSAGLLAAGLLASLKVSPIACQSSLSRGQLLCSWKLAALAHSKHPC